MDEIFRDMLDRMGIADLSLQFGAFDEADYPPIDWNAHRECEKCGRKWTNTDPVSELVCWVHRIKSGAIVENFLCLPCIQKLDRILPAEVLLRIGMKTAMVKISKK